MPTRPAADATTTHPPTPGPTHVARPLRADARRNRERLLRSAAVAFAERGTDASLEDVARHAGVGIGTLYRHFPTRDDLVGALIEGQVDELVALGGELLGADDPLDALRTWLTALIAHVARYRGLATSLVDARCGRGRLAESCHRQEAAAAALVERARASGALRPDVTVAEVLDLVSALGWLAERDAPTAATRLLDLVVEGLRPAAGAPM